MHNTIHAFVEKEDDVFVAHCVEHGVASQGCTQEEAIANLKEAVSLYLEEMKGIEISVVTVKLVAPDSETAYLFKGKNGDRLRTAINRILED